MRRFKSLNPHDNSVLGIVPISTVIDVKEKVDLARDALPAWRDAGVTHRVLMLRKFVEVWKLHAEEFALLASREMGMSIAESRGDVSDALAYMQWYLDNAEKYLAPEVTLDGNTEIHTTYREPYGVVAVISPWNYPASNFVWGCMQNLIAGNTVVFKHSEEVPLCGQLIERMMQEAAIPENVFNEIYGRGPVGALLARQDIDLLCFTGSTDVGLSLYRTAAQNMKRINLELGGSAPGIVFEDADLAIAIPRIFESRFGNAGQSCDALKRLIVHESIWDQTVEMLVSRLRMVQLGDPTLPQFDMGPLSSKRQVDILERQIEDATNKGAIVMHGAKRPGLLGAYYEPTLLSEVTADMRVWHEETFGPVLPIVRFSSEADAIVLANDTIYGLGANVFTRDQARAERVAAALKSGMVSVNGVSYVRPMNPFGGYKSSGLGRQHGRWGFEDVTQVKVISRKK